MSLHLFNKNQEMIKRVAKKDILVSEQTIEINVVDSLYVELPLDMWTSLPQKPVFMGVQDPYDRYSYYQYRIAEEDTHVDTVVLRGIQIGYDELKARGYVKARTFTKASVKVVLQYILSGSEWELSFLDTTFGTIDVELETSSRLEALRKVLDMFGAEIVFKTAVSGNRISSKRIDVFRELGGFKGKRFTYGDSVLNVVKEESTAELYTALVPLGKEIVKDEHKEVPEGEEVEMEIMSIRDVTWLTSAGDPVNKPRGQEYIELEKATAVYGFTESTPRIGIFEDTSAETAEELTHNAYEALLEASRPKVHFKATVEAVGDLEIGETVAIIRPELEYRYLTRVFKIVRNLLDNNVSELEFGDVLAKSPYQRFKDFTSSQDKIKEELEGSIRDTADGKNKIFRSEFEPTEGMTKGDLWYKPLLNGEVEMYQYDGDQWVLIISSHGNEFAEKALEEAHDRIQDARDYADELRKIADSILAGLGVGKIEDVHADIVSGILENVGERMSGIDSTIDTVTGETYQLIFDIQENPAGYLVGYNEVEERSDLYKRVIGEDEAGIQSKVSRFVMSSGLVQTEVANQTSGFSTRFYQIENSFSMSITDRDRIVTEINASDKGVYVKGKYITLDSNVDVAGDFTVQGSAVVGQLDANIITTGTLNAGRINVINLNADSISTGTLKGIRIEGGGGGFIVPKEADGVYNNYRPIGTTRNGARWKFDNSNYIYQDSQEMALFLGVTGKSSIAFNVDGEGHTVLRMGSTEGSSSVLKSLGGQYNALQVRNRQDTGYIPLHASDFLKGSSRKLKTAIKETESQLDKVISTPVYEFEYRNNTSSVLNRYTATPNKDVSHIGIMYEDAPDLIQGGGETVSITNMVGVMWKAIQELNSKIEDMEEKLYE